MTDDSPAQPAAAPPSPSTAPGRDAVGDAADEAVSAPVIESVVLPVRPGMEAAFEQAMAQAVTIISRQRGFRGFRLSRCIERPNEYLLHVEWATLADHTVGFRESADYESWRAALHHFYDPVPQVDHFTDVSLG